MASQGLLLDARGGRPSGDFQEENLRSDLCAPGISATNVWSVVEEPYWKGDPCLLAHASKSLHNASTVVVLFAAKLGLDALWQLPCRIVLMVPLGLCTEM